ncbi:hypothetical protein [Brevibacillus borstelensis]|uniref:hypothetical protein n=1 Tax=Brevibacillus TaxID=55080 RepID=UPI0030FA4623
MASDVIRDWFSHTADLIVEHVDEQEGRVRIYFLSSMADNKVVYTKVLPELRQLDLQNATISEVENRLGVPASQRIIPAGAGHQPVAQGCHLHSCKRSSLWIGDTCQRGGNTQFAKAGNRDQRTWPASSVR